MVKKRMELRKAYVRSEFQPLSHWATLGYDIDLIERTTSAEDKQMNPQLGMTFRVHVRGSTDETIEQPSIARASKCNENKGMLEGKRSVHLTTSLTLKHFVG